MKKSLKRGVSVFLAAVMLMSAVVFAGSANAAQTDSQTAAKSYGLPEKIEDGAILHCWCWNFNTIKENLPLIAEAGFKSVQTSPINEIKKGGNGQLVLKSTNGGNWWYQYQPTDYTIGNYMLGTEDEFKDMCVEAHKYGIKVIVDIVGNHCTSDFNAISSHVKNIAGSSTLTFHKVSQISDWSNRQQVTQGHLTGLWDLNTQNAKVQQMIVDYMQDVLDDGADGFRFDAAKHIELPDDDASYAGNYWPTILDNDAEFQYGEILIGADRAADYAKLMKITAEAYGTNLRVALEKHKVTATTAKNYRLTGVDAGKLVTWVESHDTYCEDDDPSQNKYSSWYKLNNKQIRQGWAFIAAQGDTTPLFFARPKGSGERIEGGTTKQNFTQKWGENTIGIDGDGNYYSAGVAEVNKFRNAMVGEGKKLVDVVKGGLVTMIERGSKGAVIVSVSENDNNVNVASSLPDGEYTDRIGGGVFTVANGKLTGSIKAGEIVVLYQDEEEPVVYGDVDGDGDVTIQDATMIQRELAEFTNTDGSRIIDLDDPEKFDIADFNRDGFVNILDVTAIQRKLAGFA